MVTTRPPKTIVKPTALGPVANTDTKLLIYGLFQKGRVLAQDGERYQRRSVAGVATDAIGASASRPKAWALTASLCRPSSESLRRLPVWSKYSNAQWVSRLHRSKGCLNPASRSDTCSFRVRSSLPAVRPAADLSQLCAHPVGLWLRHGEHITAGGGFGRYFKLRHYQIATRLGRTSGEVGVEPPVEGRLAAAVAVQGLASPPVLFQSRPIVCLDHD